MYLTITSVFSGKSDDVRGRDVPRAVGAESRVSKSHLSLSTAAVA